MSRQSMIGLKPICWLSSVWLALLAHPLPAQSHPHVFVDGGVDFVFDEKNLLSTLLITWLYDEFETLYILSSYGMSVDSDGELAEADRQELIRYRNDWPIDFDGSAHLSVDRKNIALEWPENLDAELIDGRLRITFLRKLTNAVDLTISPATLAFYESSYFFDFSVTQPPQLHNAPAQCRAEVVPFVPDAQGDALQVALTKLSREQTPDIENVGALFADQIELRCG